jgi:hypothetical protein
MKVRMGFVSNSSCSSFMIVGILASKIEAERDPHYDIVEKYEQLGFDVEAADGDYSDSIIGLSVSRFPSDYGFNEIELDTLNDKIKKCKDLFEKNLIDPEDVRLFHIHLYS